MAAADKPAALVDHDSAEALLKRMEWTVLRRLDGLLQGDHRTLMRGAGLDLADLREYQHHDDVRHIDCLLYTSPSPRDGLLSRMPSSA